MKRAPDYPFLSRIDFIRFIIINIVNPINKQICREKQKHEQNQRFRGKWCMSKLHADEKQKHRDGPHDWPTRSEQKRKFFKHNHPKLYNFKTFVETQRWFRKKAQAQSCSGGKRTVNSVTCFSITNTSQITGTSLAATYGKERQKSRQQCGK